MHVQKVCPNGKTYRFAPGNVVQTINARYAIENIGITIIIIIIIVTITLHERCIKTVPIRVLCCACCSLSHTTNDRHARCIRFASGEHIIVISISLDFNSAYTFADRPRGKSILLFVHCRNRTNI